MSRALAFAHEWIRAWNAHDLERILAHYAEAIEFTSPRAAELVPGSGGVIRGKAALRAYWALGLARSPDLHFVLEDVFATVDGASLLYRNQRGQRVAETCGWDADGKVVRSIAAYAPPAAIVLGVVARVPTAGVQAFARYEDAVLPRVAAHGGQVELRLRADDGATELHVVRFPDQAALAAYRADPARAERADDLAASGATVEAFPAHHVAIG
ncbi:MAG: nuclear transport factor 2 family protein [Kofleriaceae bacterium]